jgi:hypothetical protein
MNRTQKALIAKRMEKLTALNGGRLTPTKVLLDAKNKTSPMHQQFEWTDSKAAQLHRLWQARNLIKTVKLEIRTEHRIITTVRYVRDPEADAKEQGYVDVVTLRDNKTLAYEALTDELKRASVLMDRALDLSYALNLDSAASEIIERIDLMKRSCEDLAA